MEPICPDCGKVMIEIDWCATEDCACNSPCELADSPMSCGGAVQRLACSCGHKSLIE
jgi:hypothetical protein